MSWKRMFKPPWAETVRDLVRHYMGSTCRDAHVVSHVIKPIEQFTKKAEVHELCRMLGKGQLNQRAAQAAAWHFTDGMSWPQLIAKRLRHANGASRPYFSPIEIRQAMQIAAKAVQLAKEREQQKKSTGKSDSLSQR